MPGKWDSKVASLPRYTEGDFPSPQRERIENIKQSILNADPEAQIPPLEDILSSLQIVSKAIQLRLSLATRGQKYASSFAFGVRDARVIKDALEENLKSVNGFIEAFTELFINQIEVEGSTSIKLGDGATIRVQYEPYAAVADRDIFRNWCREQGLDREFQMHPSTIQSLVKQHLENNEPEPPGITVFNKPKIVFSKGR